MRLWNRVQVTVFTLFKNDCHAVFLKILCIPFPPNKPIIHLRYYDSIQTCRHVVIGVIRCREYSFPFFTQRILTASISPYFNFKD